jgi:hypothetical protein
MCPIVLFPLLTAAYQVVAGYEKRTNALRTQNATALDPLRATVTELNEQLTAHQEVAVLKIEVMTQQPNFASMA